MKKYAVVVRYKEGERMRYDFHIVFANTFNDAEGVAISLYPFKVEIRSIRIDD